MKKIFLVFAILLAFSFTSAFAQEATTAKKGKKVETVENKDTKAPAKAVKGAKPTIGTVVNVMEYLAGSNGTLNKVKALELVKKGQPLGLLVGKGKSAKLYFIANSDGTIASEKLANKADGNVGVVGKIVTNGGIKMIIAELIDSIK